jgi:hypothetical protein
MGFQTCVTMLALAHRLADHLIFATAAGASAIFNIVSGLAVKPRAAIGQITLAASRDAHAIHFFEIVKTLRTLAHWLTGRLILVSAGHTLSFTVGGLAFIAFKTDLSVCRVDVQKAKHQANEGGLD